MNKAELRELLTSDADPEATIKAALEDDVRRATEAVRDGTPLDPSDPSVIKLAISLAHAIDGQAVALVRPDGVVILTGSDHRRLFGDPDRPQPPGLMAFAQGLELQRAAAERLWMPAPPGPLGPGNRRARRAAAAEARRRAG